MRLVWVAYMDPAGFGAVRPKIAPDWMKKDESASKDEPTPMKLVEVLDTGMGGAWPAMDFMDLRTTPAELKDFFRSDDGKLTSFFDYPDTCTQAVFAKVRDESDGVHLLLSCRGST